MLVVLNARGIGKIFTKIRREVSPLFGLNPLRSRGEQSDRIEVMLRGGLGNQLFGYATGVTVARRLGVPLHLLTHNLGPPPGSSRQFELSDFVLESASWGETSRAKKYFREASFRFDPKVDNVAEGTVLDGYFQTSRYFQASAEFVKLQIRSSKLFQEGQKEGGSTPFIALHVRRGDYLSPDNQQVHGLVPETFFMSGLQALRDRVGALEALIFSDDLNVAQRLSRRLEGARPFSDNPKRSSLEVLGALSSARALCISNSSFGWWGAYLAVDNCPVIVPSPWFVNPNTNTEDLVEESWTSMGFLQGRESF